VPDGFPELTATKRIYTRPNKASPHSFGRHFLVAY